MKKKDYGVACFVLGLIGLLASFVPIGGLIMPMIAIVLAGQSRESGMKTAGLVLGILGLIISLIATGMFVVGFLLGI